MQEPSSLEVKLPEMPVRMQAHLPGTIHEMSDYSAYEVQASGAWKKVRSGLKGKRRRRFEKAVRDTMQTEAEALTTGVLTNESL